MGLAPGTRFGVHEIVAPLGAGGMGEVYRARDTKLGRDVALKVIPDIFANDPERLARFEREARTLASLNHSHIGQIYGFEQLDGTSALVMELVEGEDLSARIAGGPLPLDEALSIASQIASALEAAHGAGVIHRDLKPANVKVRADGTVKVLDFGLAKPMMGAAGPPGSSGDQGVSVATLTSPAMTLQGVILGTAAYMAPEQARGRPVDKRADIWSFGVVLYEMLTGTRAFPGEDVSETLATVIKNEPDWQRLPAETPPAVRRLLRRSLAKDPSRRLREAGDALIELQDAVAGADDHALNAQAPAPKQLVRRVLVAAMAVALAAAASVATWVLTRSAPRPEPTTRFTITLPDTDRLPVGTDTLLALAPDGRALVYRVVRDGRARLMRRQLDQFDAVPVAIEPGIPLAPFFSADGVSIGFTLSTSLKKIALSGGPSQMVAELERGVARGADWLSDGRIIFGVTAPPGRLMQVSPAGAEPITLFTTTDSRRVWYPQMLPGGKTVLFTLSEGAADGGELHLVRLDTGEHRTVLPAAAAGRLLPSGHLVFVRSSQLWAVPFDLDRLEPIGSPVSIVPGVRVEPGGAVQVAVSAAGALAYIPGRASTARTLRMVTRDGGSTTIPVPAREYFAVARSPDETRVAVQVGDVANADVWVVDVARGTLTRVTNEPGFDGEPLWSHDGRDLVFGSERDDRWELRRKAADGTGPTEVLVRFDSGVLGVRPHSWSPDGKILLFDLDVKGNDRDIGLLPVDGSGKWTTLIGASGVYESQPALSPDGRWLAYTSTETGQVEVYVQRFGGVGGRRLVSVGGGHNATWARDGGSLFYLRGAPPDTVMEVAFKADARGDESTVGTPSVFGSFTGFARVGLGNIYDVSRDGSRVLMMAPEDQGRSSQHQINVVLNWSEELKQLVPIR